MLVMIDTATLYSAPTIDLFHFLRIYSSVLHSALRHLGNCSKAGFLGYLGLFFVATTLADDLGVLLGSVLLVTLHNHLRHNFFALGFPFLAILHGCICKK